MRKVAA